MNLVGDLRNVVGQPGHGREGPECGCWTDLGWVPTMCNKLSLLMLWSPMRNIFHIVSFGNVLKIFFSGFVLLKCVYNPYKTMPYQRHCFSIRFLHPCPYMNILHNFLHGEDTISLSSFHHIGFPLPPPPPEGSNHHNSDCIDYIYYFVWLFYYY